MPNQFGLAGANPGKNTKLAPIYTGRWSSGYWPNRSPLRDAATSRIVEKFYGAAGDALIAGSNVEITNKLTLARRPGNSIYPPGHGRLTPNFNSVDRFYDFRLFDSQNESIILMIDEAQVLQALLPGSFIPQTVWRKDPNAGQSYMQSVGNTLYWGDGVDNKKWLQSLVQWMPNIFWNTATTPFMSTFLIDPNGNLQQLTGTVVPIDYVYVQNNTVEIITHIDLSQILTAGQTVTFPTGMTASFLDGQTVTISVVGSDPFGNAFFFNFITSNYPQTPETSKFASIYPGDGMPAAGPTEPQWNVTVPSASNNFKGGLTYDGTVQWTNRGSPVENWGIQPPTDMVAPRIIPGVNPWAADTVYSLASVVLDINGNLQQVVKSGLSGSSIIWNSTLNGNTYDGAPSTQVVWQLIASAAMLVWYPSTFYVAGSFLIEAGCLFQLQKGLNAPYIVGDVEALLYPGDSSGTFTLSHPLPTGEGVEVVGLTGLNFAVTGTGTTGAFAWDIIDSAGDIVGSTNPFPGQTVSSVNVITEATINVPVVGEYSFTITHGDGLMWGIGGGAFLVSGTSPQNITNGITAANGYPVFSAGTNLSVTANAGNAWVDTYNIYFPQAGAYAIELNLGRASNSNAGAHITCNGRVLASGQTSGGGTTGTVEPAWPSWTLTDAPNYPTVSETSGLMTWQNIGPITDFIWYAAANFTLPNTQIIDTNGYSQFPYETGKSGSSPPTFSMTVDALTADNPNLYWINQGKSGANPAGNISTSNGGWKYAISLVNTLDDTVSNATPISVSTGNFTGAIAVYLPPGSGLPSNLTKIDSQADYVAIWRTTDGQSQPFLIPGANDYTLPITLPLWQYLQYGYEDTTPDTGLNNLIEAPIVGENTPPAKGASSLAYYLQRLFYRVGNTVYWTTGPDTPVGNGFNGSAPLNYDEQQSLVWRIVPTTSGAMIFTVSDINLITSTTTSAGTTINPAIPLVEGIGISSYNALDTNGSIIGFFTTDSQFIIVDPANGFSSAGFPIGDQLRLNNGTPGQSWNPANTYVAWHVNGEDQAWYLADGSYGWYRLMSTPAPEAGGYTWSPFATIVGGVKCVQSVETSPGVHNLLLGSTVTGPLRVRDLDYFMDGTTAYSASATLGSMVLAQPGQYAFISFIVTESVKLGTPLVLAMLIDDALPYYQGPFDVLKHWINDPPILKVSRSLLGQRFYMSELENDAALCRHVQAQVSWAAEAYPNELLTFTVFGGYLQEL